MNITTWNMQGSNATSENKWQRGVVNLFSTQDVWRPDALCLQECGPLPASVRMPAILTVNFRSPIPNAPNEAVSLYSFGGTEDRPLGYLAINEWDVAGNRVNTVVIVRLNKRLPDPPTQDDLFLTWARQGAQYRPAVGVRYAGIVFYSFHAISPGGADASGIIAAIAESHANERWYIGADWNRETINVLPQGTLICPSNAPTYPATAPRSSYDYVIYNGRQPTRGVTLSLLMSDHLPVAYIFNNDL